MFVGLKAAWFLAVSPTSTPVSVNATTLDVYRNPNVFVMRMTSSSIHVAATLWKDAGLVRIDVTRSR